LNKKLEITVELSQYRRVLKEFQQVV